MSTEGRIREFVRDERGDAQAVAERVRSWILAGAEAEGLHFYFEFLDLAEGRALVAAAIDSELSRQLLEAYEGDLGQMEQVIREHFDQPDNPELGARLHQAIMGAATTAVLNTVSREIQAYQPRGGSES